MRVLVLLCVLLSQKSLLCGEPQASTDGPRPNEWHGMVLDVTTPAQAVGVFGQPSKDQLERLRVKELARQLTPKHKEKIFRMLEFGSIDSFDHVRLFFQDGRLVLVELDFEKTKRPVPDSLSGIYGIEFAPLITAWQERADPEAYEHHEGKVYPKRYASEYRLAAATDQSYVVADVNNKAIGTVFRDLFDTKFRGLPGKVETLQLISRTLDNKDAGAILK